MEVAKHKLFRAFLLLSGLGFAFGWALFAGTHWLEVLAASGNAAEWVQGIGSVGAIAATLIVWTRQAILTRDTQKQALRPHLSLIVRTQSVTKEKPNIVLRLDNNGLGPAIVKSIDV